jgi:hypothetical protein
MGSREDYVHVGRLLRGYRVIDMEALLLKWIVALFGAGSRKVNGYVILTLTMHPALLEPRAVSHAVPAPDMPGHVELMVSKDVATP